MPKEKRTLKHYIFWAIIAALIVLSFIILRPFFIALISGFILAFLCLPLYKLLSKKLSRSLSAIICILLILLVILIPLTIIITKIIQQASSSLDINSISSQLIDKLSSLNIIHSLNIDFLSIREKAIELFIGIFSNAITTLPNIILSFVISLLAVYYILVNWSFLTEKLTSLVPFKNKKHVASEIGYATKGIIYGYFLIALIEFAFSSLAFYIIGVKYFLLLGALIAILAFIPGLGPGVIYLPTTLYYVYIGNYLTALGVLITGVIIAILIETILFGRIVGKKAKIHPLIMLLGILGGVPLFGLFGFIIGPIVLVYTLKLIEEASSSR